MSECVNSCVFFRMLKVNCVVQRENLNRLMMDVGVEAEEILASSVMLPALPQKRTICIYFTSPSGYGATLTNEDSQNEDD